MVEPPRFFSDSASLPPDTTLVDARASMLRELFSIRNPQAKKEDAGRAAAEKRFIEASRLPPTYVYFPWLKTAVLSLPEQEYFELRTARNRNVITPEEQNAYRAGTVGIAGLSVGSSAAFALAMSGGPRRMKLADFDVVEATNLNRLRAGLTRIGQPKTDAIATAIWELDPYAKLELYDAGITSENIQRFVSRPRLDAIIDEMESIEQKIRIRYAAKREKIPVLMATDNGNGIILDVERFDVEPERPLFHGLVELPEADRLGELSYSEWLALATKIIGPEYLEERMRDSLLEIGHSISSVPQLGSSASFAGIAVAYAVRLLLTGGELPSGRYAYSIEQLVNTAYNSPENKERRERSLAEFMSAFASPA